MNRASEPSGVLAFVVLDDLGAMVRRRKLVDFAPQTIRNVREQGVAASKHDMFEKVTSDSFVTLHDRVVDVLLNTLSSDIISLSKFRLEEDLRTAESFFANDELASIR